VDLKRQTYEAIYRAYTDTPRMVQHNDWKMPHREFTSDAMKSIVSIFCTLTLVPGSALPAADPPRSARPNVILMLADDLGYETIGANGGTSYKTPILDNLACPMIRVYRQP
jgi:hypothetical protein